MDLRPVFGPVTAPVQEVTQQAEGEPGVGQPDLCFRIQPRPHLVGVDLGEGERQRGAERTGKGLVTLALLAPSGAQLAPSLLTFSWSASCDTLQFALRASR